MHQRKTELIKLILKNHELIKAHDFKTVAIEYQEACLLAFREHHAKTPEDKRMVDTIIAETEVIEHAAYPALGELFAEYADTKGAA